MSNDKTGCMIKTPLPKFEAGDKICVTQDRLDLDLQSVYVAKYDQHFSRSSWVLSSWSQLTCIALAESTIFHYTIRYIESETLTSYLICLCVSYLLAYQPNTSSFWHISQANTNLTETEVILWYRYARFIDCSCSCGLPAVMVYL